MYLVTSVTARSLKPSRGAEVIDSPSKVRNYLETAMGTLRVEDKELVVPLYPAWIEMIHQRLLHLCPSKDLPVAAYHSVVQSENHSLPQDRVIVTSVVLLCMQSILRFSTVLHCDPYKELSHRFPA